MKKNILLSVLLVSTALSQTNDTTYIKGDSLKSGNIQIFENWDYHPGDDSTWGLPAFSSVGWKTVDCTLDLDSIKAYGWNGIGWFRKTIVIDSSLMNKTVAMTLNHYGASQFYIDGKLINSFGTVSKNSDGEEIYYSNSKPIVINFNSSSTYLFAVRYSNHLPLDYPYLYKIFRNTIGFYATFKNWTEGINFYGITQANDSVLNAWLIGILLSISVIYFLLFLFYSKQKEYLYYTIFTFAFALALATSLFDNIIYSEAFYFLSFEIISRIVLFAVFLGVLAFLYQIFYGRMLKLFRYFLTLGIGIFIWEMIIPVNGTIRKVVLAFVFITSIEILRVLFLAIKRKKNNAWVIGAGVCVFTVGILSAIIYGLTGGQVNSIYVVLILLFSIPLSMSIYLARSSSQTNKNLETQLATVKQLSEEAIEQEKAAAKLTIETQLVKAENERKTQELEEAKQLQLSMLPKELPKLLKLDIAVYMKTATEVGGDYYDFNVDSDGTLTVAIGDATGHGMRAGTMVTSAKSLFNSYAANPDILFTFQEMTRCIKQMQFQSLAMCMTMLKIKNNKLLMSAAGMPPVYLFRNKHKIIEEYLIEGMPLGTMYNFPYELKELELFLGDTILLMSDGFPELNNQHNEMFGYRRARNSFEEVAEKDPENIIAYLKNEGNRWSDNKEPDDDVTFVVIKVK
jgi:serine phosphatase RsbU (regulator of sigma subunit)